jgi:hypothetical protein
MWFLLFMMTQYLSPPPLGNVDLLTAGIIEEAYSKRTVDMDQLMAIVRMSGYERYRIRYRKQSSEVDLINENVTKKFEVKKESGKISEIKIIPETLIERFENIYKERMEKAGW